MTELPKPDSVFNEEYNAKAKSLYRLVYDAQSSANNKKELIYCRIVGYLLLHPINLTARGAVLNELASIHGLDGTQPSFKIYELGKMYLEHLIRPCEYEIRHVATDCAHSKSIVKKYSSPKAQGKVPVQQLACLEAVV